MGEEGAGPESNLIRGLGLFSYVPPTWTYECDEDLIHFLYDHLGKEDENLGSVKQYVESIDVSSYTVGTGLLLCLDTVTSLNARSRTPITKLGPNPCPHRPYLVPLPLEPL